MQQEPARERIRRKLHGKYSSDRRECPKTAVAIPFAGRMIYEYGCECFKNSDMRIFRDRNGRIQQGLVKITRISNHTLFEPFEVSVFFRVDIFS